MATFLKVAVKLMNLQSIDKTNYKKSVLAILKLTLCITSSFIITPGGRVSPLFSRQKYPISRPPRFVNIKRLLSPVKRLFGICEMSWRRTRERQNSLVKLLWLIFLPFNILLKIFEKFCVLSLFLCFVRDLFLSRHCVYSTYP